MFLINQVNLFLLRLLLLGMQNYFRIIYDQLFFRYYYCKFYLVYHYLLLELSNYYWCFIIFVNKYCEL